MNSLSKAGHGNHLEIWKLFLCMVRLRFAIKSGSMLDTADF